jgi:hypothetical protein
MKKKIEWIIINGNGKELWEESPYATRRETRAEIKYLKRDIFEPWHDNVILPLTIERREWVLVDKKVVR